MFDDWRLTTGVMWVLCIYLSISAYGALLGLDIMTFVEIVGWAVFYGGLRDLENFESFDYEFLHERNIS